MDFVTHVTLLAAVGVAGLHELLKLNIVPLSFPNKHPVPTNIILSVLAAIFAARQDLLVPHSWTDWVGVVGTVAIVAAVIYNQLLGQWAQLKAMEGPGK